MQRRRWSWREAALWLLIVTDEDLTTRPGVEWGIHKTTYNEAESNGTRHVISCHDCLHTKVVPLPSSGCKSASYASEQLTTNDNITPSQSNHAELYRLSSQRIRKLRNHSPPQPLHSKPHQSHVLRGHCTRTRGNQTQSQHMDEQATKEEAVSVYKEL